MSKDKRINLTGVPVSISNFAITINGAGLGFGGVSESSLPHRTTSEPVVGWRAWRLSKDETGEPVLLSAVQDTEWTGPVFRADKKPGLSDTYGVHAFRRTYMNTEYAGCTVEGEVLLFGKTIVFEKGIRAEAAMIRRLVLFPGGWTQELKFDMGTVSYTVDPHGNYRLTPAKLTAPAREIHTATTGDRCGIAETTALVESLAKRYDCEVSVGQVVKRSDFEPERKRLRRRTRLIQKPTQEEVDRYGSR